MLPCWKIAITKMPPTQGESVRLRCTATGWHLSVWLVNGRWINFGSAIVQGFTYGFKICDDISTCAIRLDRAI